MSPIVQAPMCVVCRHLHRTPAGPPACTAFPGRIPAAIWTGGADHREAFPGDGGVRFAADPARPPGLVSEILARYGPDPDRKD